jgi:ketosteroid isomerase-like protein
MAVPSRMSRINAATAKRNAGMLLAIPSLLLPLLASCSGNTGDLESIRALVAREVEAVNKKDLKTLSEVWSQASGISLFDVPPPGRFAGWEAIGRQFNDFFDKFSEIHLGVENVKVEVSGPIGYATYDWMMSGRMGDYALNDRGQATAIYRKEGGTWRLVHLHYSSVPVYVAAGSPTPGATPAPSPSPAPSASATPKDASRPR